MDRRSGLCRYRLVIWATAVIPVLAAGSSVFAEEKREIRGLLKDQKNNAWKIRRDGEKTYVWAGGTKAGGEGAQWYDFTGAPFPPEELQFGIGKDTIRAIDDPYFVSPDDSRLLEISPSSYRPKERPKITDEIMVIGYFENGIARAYPTALLDHHELVNDEFKGKPVTVGW